MESRHVNVVPGKRRAVTGQRSQRPRSASLATEFRLNPRLQSAVVTLVIGLPSSRSHINVTCPGAINTAKPRFSPACHALLVHVQPHDATQDPMVPVVLPIPPIRLFRSHRHPLTLNHLVHVNLDHLNRSLTLVLNKMSRHGLTFFIVVMKCHWFTLLAMF